MGTYIILTGEEFKLGSSSECLLEFDTHSKPLGHHGKFDWTPFQPFEFWTTPLLGNPLYLAYLFDILLK